MVTCPLDHKDDALQSIPALVAGGVASGSFSGSSSGITHIDGKYGYTSGSTTLYGTLTSNIAQMLAMPKPPEKVGFWSLYGWSFLFYISICIIVGPFFVWRSFKKSMVSDPDERKRVFTLGFSIFCIFALLVGWVPEFLFLLLFIVKRTINDRLDFPRRIQLWQESCDVWQRLYYCHRCGIVFDPVKMDWFPPQQMGGYLNIDKYRR